MRKLVLLSILLFTVLSFSQPALGQETIKQADTLLHLSAVDSTALDSIKTLNKDGKYAEAETQARELLAKVEAEHGAESLEAANVLDKLVVSLRRGGKASEPETFEFAERTVSIKEHFLGPHDLQVAESLNNLAILYYFQGKYTDVEPLFKRSLVIREETLGPEHPDVASSLNNLATVYNVQGKYAEAKPLYMRALAVWEKTLGLEHPQVARGLSNLAGLYVAQGKYAEAVPLLKRALEIWENALGQEHPDVANSLNGLAILYEEQGKYAEAEQLHERALEIREKTLGTEHPLVAKSLNGLANACIEQGKFTEAEPLLKRALAIKEKILGPEHPDVAHSLNSLAIFYFRQGKYAEAEPLYMRTLAINEKVLGPENPDVAINLNNLASLYVEQEKYDEAEPLYMRALAIREKTLGSEHPFVARSLNNLANLYSKRSKHPEAESLYVQSITISEKTLGKDHPDLASQLQSFGQHCRRAGNSEKAIGLVGRAFTIRKKNFHDNSSGMSEPDALTYSQYLRESASGFLSTYFDSDTANDNLDNAAADVLFSTKGSVMDGIFERRKAVVRETDSTNLALAKTLRLTKFLLSNLFVQGPDEDVEDYRNEIDSLSKLANEQEADLARHSASFSRQQDYKDISAERIAWLLPHTSALVEYLKYDFQQLNPDSTISHYLVLVLDGEAEPVIIDLGKASEIDPLVDQYRKHMLSVSSSGQLPNAVDFEDYKKISQALYNKIWMPIAEHLSDKELVFVAPDGGLNMLSFAGLIDDEGKYLVEKFALHYLSSGRDLIRLKYKPSPVTGLFALGDPDYNATVTARLSKPKAPVDSSSESTYYATTRNVRSGCGELKEMTVNPLPGTRIEIEQIAKSWQESSVEPLNIYFRSNASEEKFKADAPGNRVIHLATHGYFLEGACKPKQPKARFGSDVGYVGENPLLLSGLFFAGANLHGEGSEQEDAEDGILTAYEVSEMVLDGTELVVLSACETGLGEVKEGEGVYGLRRAFQMAGARTVISALWSVSDKATAEMMGQLYGKNNETLPETIRKIQLDRISALRSKNKVDHPFTWGAFIALGDWR